jgi:hypothetical protein
MSINLLYHCYIYITIIIVNNDVIIDHDTIYLFVLWPWYIITIKYTVMVCENIFGTMIINCFMSIIIIFHYFPDFFMSFIV